MPARTLVEPNEIASFLEIGEEEYPPALEALRIGAVKFFERRCGRTRSPFSDAITNRVEYHDGTGDGELLLDYAPVSIASVEITAPSETLTAPDATVILVVPGERRISRPDGGIFGDFDVARAVKVTYNTLPDLPEDARLQVCRLIAQVWRQRGSEDASAETVSGYQRTFAEMAASDGQFVQCVRDHTRAVLL